MCIACEVRQFGVGVREAAASAEEARLTAPQLAWAAGLAHSRMAAVAVVVVAAVAALQRTTAAVVVRQLVLAALVPGRTAGITCARLPRGNTQAARLARSSCNACERYAPYAGACGVPCVCVGCASERWSLPRAGCCARDAGLRGLVHHTSGARVADVVSDGCLLVDAHTTGVLGEGAQCWEVDTDVGRAEGCVRGDEHRQSRAGRDCAAGTRACSSLVGSIAVVRPSAHSHAHLARLSVVNQTANITTANGTLSVCFDHRRQKFSIPRFCWCTPVNIRAGVVDELSGKADEAVEAQPLPVAVRIAFTVRFGCCACVSRRESGASVGRST